MKFEEFYEQIEQIKQAFEKARKNFDCDNVEMMFKTDDGELIPIGCIEGGYAPNEDTNVLIFSTGKEEVLKMLKAMLGTPTVDANNIDVGAKLEELIKDDNP